VIVFRRLEDCDVAFEVVVKCQEGVLRGTVVIDIEYGTLAVLAGELDYDYVRGWIGYLFPSVGIQGGVNECNGTSALLRVRVMVSRVDDVPGVVSASVTEKINVGFLDYHYIPVRC
jgi:hypothetical protein